MTGSLQIKRGKYYAVLNLKGPDGKRKQKWIASDIDAKGGKKKAEKFLRETLCAYEGKPETNDSDILFCDYILEWLPVVKHRVDPTTYQSYEVNVKSQIEPYFRSTKRKLVDLSPEDIQEFVDAKISGGRKDGKGGLAPITVKRLCTVIQLAIKTAMKSKLIAANPCEDIVFPKTPKTEMNFLNAEQLDKMLDTIRNEKLYSLVYFTIVYGMRRSEVLGLKWDSVNWAQNTITVKHTVVKVTKLVEKDSTKNESSFRTYPLLPEIADILRKLRTAEERNSSKFGAAYHKNSYIFKHENGTPFAPDYVTKQFGRILQKYDLPKIRFHDLRHSCASLLLSNGFTLKDVQEWLGHSDIRTTANIYIHLDDKRKNKIAESLSSTLRC